MNYLIEQQSQLDQLRTLFKELSEASGYIAVDTEFLREKTYNAKLCLVQLGIGDNQYCIDVLAIEDLSLLANLMDDERVLKIFHAARQDMEVLYQTFGVMPSPIFDTQLAAAFCGLDMQIGYSALVAHRLDIELPKSQARTDWTRRPLSDVQVAYAAEDVKHLEYLYTSGLADLSEQGKSDWYQQELQSYYDVDKYIIDPATVYKRLSGGGLKLKQQYRLKELAQWRETIAQKRNIPRSWVIKDDQLYDLATQGPETEDEVIQSDILNAKLSQRFSAEIAKLIAESEVGELPLWRKVEPLDKQDRSRCTSMMKQLKECAQKHQVAQGLLATRKDIESIYRHRQSSKLLSGWRTEVVGQPMLDFMDSIN